MEPKSQRGIGWIVCDDERCFCGGSFCSVRQSLRSGNAASPVQRFGQDGFLVASFGEKIGHFNGTLFESGRL